MKKGKLYSSIFLKCPRCNEGDLFVNKNPYTLRRFFDMPKNCNKCGLRYEAEPGFFYGAMFISYALSIIITGFVWLVLTLLGYNFWTVIWFSIVVLIASVPVLFKNSRAIWMNLFIPFEGGKKVSSISEKT